MTRTDNFLRTSTTAWRALSAKRPSAPCGAITAVTSWNRCSISFLSCSGVSVRSFGSSSRWKVTCVTYIRSWPARDVRERQFLDDVPLAIQIEVNLHVLEIGGAEVLEPHLEIDWLIRGGDAHARLELDDARRCR